MSLVRSKNVEAMHIDKHGGPVASTNKLRKRAAMLVYKGPPFALSVGYLVPDGGLDGGVENDVVRLRGNEGHVVYSQRACPV